jgi:hypothetical protein
LQHLTNPVCKETLLILFSTHPVALICDGVPYLARGAERPFEDGIAEMLNATKAGLWQGGFFDKFSLC